MDTPKYPLVLAGQMSPTLVKTELPSLVFGIAFYYCGTIFQVLLLTPALTSSFDVTSLPTIVTSSIFETTYVCLMAFFPHRKHCTVTSSLHARRNVCTSSA